MLLVFAVAIAWNLARGRAPDCHCFGQLHSSPASLGTVARNLALAAVAGFAAVELGEPVAVAALGGVALAVLTPLSIAASRRDRAAGAGAVSGSEGLAVGTRAPGFRLPALQGLSVTLDSLLGRARPVLLVFTDSHCAPCAALAPRIASWQRELEVELTIAVIERRTADGSRIDAADHGRRNILLQRDSEIADTFGVEATPSAVLVAVDGTIASAVAAGSAEIEQLVAGTTDGSEPTADLPRVRRVRPIVRRELLQRGAMAWTAGLLAGPTGALARRRRRRRPCPDDQHSCGEVCCGAEQDCLEGRCRCTQRDFPDKCGKACVDTRTDQVHCGGCYRVPPMEPPPGGRTRSRLGRRPDPATPCESGEMCVNGRCVGGDDNPCDRVEGTVCCGGEETGLNFDESNCGSCGAQCRSGRNPKCCWGECVDVFHDPGNCGGCGNRCHDDELCIKGECKRQRGCTSRQGRACKYRGGGRSCYDKRTESCCGGKVVQRSEFESDETNCGGCAGDGGQDCRVYGDYGCCNGECCDYNAQTCCPGGCKNTGLDEANCGACGNVCRPGEFCRFGTCTCPPGVTCG
jgi:peroxiredoxin